MEKIELQLDEQTLARALKLAEFRQCSLEELITEIIEQMEVSETVDDPFLGMFADEPELIDQVIESIMMAREAQISDLAWAPSFTIFRLNTVILM